MPESRDDSVQTMPNNKAEYTHQLFVHFVVAEVSPFQNTQEDMIPTIEHHFPKELLVRGNEFHSKEKPLFLIWRGVLEKELRCASEPFGFVLVSTCYSRKRMLWLSPAITL